MNKEIEIPEGYEVRIDGNRVIIELKESKDERIRKEIRNFLIDMECKKDWISYLERQKEQKPAKDTALQEAFINSKIDYTLEEKCDASDYAEIILPTSVIYGENEEEYKLHKIIEAAFIAGQKKKQQPAEKQDYSDLNDLERAIHRGFLSAGVENVPVAIIKETAQECLAQMKPAEWNEDDENMLKTIFDSLETYAKNTLPCLKSVVEDEIAWLKSLRPQPHWKPSKQEIDAFETALKGEFQNGVYPATILCELFSKLKKLYYNDKIFHWKPSKKQMEALEEAFRKDGGNEYRKVINSLYCDLQKLL